MNDERSPKERALGLWAEFRQFAMRGNAPELLVAVLVGGAFTTVVNSFASDMLGPFLALATNSVDLKTLSYTVRPDLVVRYGAFLQSLFNFSVVALLAFGVVKAVRLLRR